MNRLLSLLGFDPTRHSVKVEMPAGLTTFLNVTVKVPSGRFKEVTIVMYILAALFVLKYIFN